MSASPYLGCMKAHLLEDKPITYPCAVEPKLDGFRITFVNGDGYTRNGNTYDTFRPYAEILEDLVPRNVHVDAEICASNWNETSKLLKRLKNIDQERIAQEVTVNIFDAFSPDTIGVEPYIERRKAVVWLADALKIRGPRRKFAATWMRIAQNRAELDQIYDDARAEGMEGVMIKTLSGVYVPNLKNSKSWDWRKRKPFKDITVTIKAVTHGWELCRECMTIERREARAFLANVGPAPVFEADDLKPEPHCPTCHGAAKGVPRHDLLGSLVCVDEHGNEWGVGMGFTDVDKVAFMKDPPIGRPCDVKTQDEAQGPSANEIQGRHAVFLRFRDDM